jgi:hypothetical protein
MYINSDNKVEEFRNNLKKNNKENFQNDKGFKIAIYVIMGIGAVVISILIILFIRYIIKNNREE